MAGRFEIGSAWVGVHADKTGFKGEVKAAATEASRDAKVQVKIEADEKKLDQLKRKATDLGTAGAKATLMYERAQIELNRAQAKANKINEDATATADDKALAMNRVRQAELNVKEAVERGSRAEEDRNHVLKQTEEIHRRVGKVVAETARNAGPDGLMGRILGRTKGNSFGELSSKISGVGSAIGGVLSNFSSFGKAAETVGAGMLNMGASMVTVLNPMSLLIGAAVGLAVAIPLAAAGVIAFTIAVQAVAGAVAVAATGMFLLGSVAGTIMGAFHGVTDALSAHKAMEDEVGGAATRNASAQAASARAIQAATQRIGDAKEQAAEQVKNAEQRLADAQDRAKQSQEDLNDARRDALQDLKDLKRAARDAALSEKEAALDLEEAKKRLKEIQDARSVSGKHGRFSGMDERRALLDLEEAQNRYRDSTEDASKARKENTDAERKGVEGSDRVVDAKKAQAKANRDVKDAELGVAKAQRDGARAIKQAVEALADAKRAARDQAAAASVASAATSKYAKAMADLSPAGRAFVKQMLKVQDVGKKLSDTAATATLPGVTQFLKDALTLTPMVNTHVRTMGTTLSNLFRGLGTYLKGDVFKGQFSNILHSVEVSFKSIGHAIKSLVPAFVTLAEAGGPLLEQLAGWIDSISIKFSKWLEAKRASGQLKDFFDGIGKTMHKVAVIGGLVFHIGLDLFRIFFPPAKKGSDGFLDGVIKALTKVRVWLANPENQKMIKDWLDKIKHFPIWIKDVMIPKIRDFILKFQEWIDKFHHWKEVIKVFIDVVTSYYKGLWTAIKWVVEQIRKKIEGWIDDFNKWKERIKRWKSDVADIWTGLKNWIGDKLDQIGSKISSFWTSAKTKWNNGLKWIKSRADDWFTKIKQALANLREGFVNTFKSIPGKLAGPVNAISKFINDHLIHNINKILPKSLEIHDIPMIGQSSSRSTGPHRGTSIGMSTGGPVTGPGTSTSDSIDARVSDGEYVHRTAAVRKYGLPFMNAVNNLSFARGGLVDIGKGVLGKIGGAVTAGPEWLMNRAISAARGPVDRFIDDRTAGGGMENLVRGLSHQLVQGIIDKGKSLAKSVASAAVGGGGGGFFGGGAPSSVSGNAAILKAVAAGRGWSTGGQWNALYNLVRGESGFRNTAQNPTSTAYGMFQFLNSTWGGVGGHKTSDPRLQSEYGLRYIGQSYGTPANAYGKWMSRSPHWYDTGGWLNPGWTSAYNGTGKAERVRTAEQEQAVQQQLASTGGDTYNFGPNSIVLDASRIRSIEDVVTMIGGLKQTSRALSASRRS